MQTPIYLNALRAFEAAARHQSFSTAAEELNVTPAAVGQLVRTLEEWLGVPLFNRSNTGKARLIVTEIGLRALPDIKAGLGRLSMGLEKMKESAQGGLLTVTVSPAFASKWLLPRIDRFQTAHPEIDVRLDTSLKPVDFASQQIDIGVRYGAGSWPGLTAIKLMEEDVFPVCSPTLLASVGGEICRDRFREMTLIHDLSMDQHTDFPSWDNWLSHAGFGPIGKQRSLTINNSAAVLQAAAEGQGIALARSVMAKEDVASGRLVRLLPEIEYTSRLAYYLVFRPSSGNLPRLIAFRNWLIEEVVSMGVL